MTEPTVEYGPSSVGHRTCWIEMGQALVVLQPNHPAQVSLAEGEWLALSEIPNLIQCLLKAQELLEEQQ